MKRRELLWAAALFPLAPACAFLRGGAKHPTLSPSLARLSGNELRIPVSELPSDDVLEVKPEKPHPELLVRRDEGGGWMVITAECTHAGCTVDWDAKGSSWLCPCHDSRYSADGAVLEGPADEPLQRAAVRVEGEELVIDLGSLRG